MHEASIALSLVELIEQTVAREGASQALSAEVEIGALSHVESEALAFAFASARLGGAAAACRLEIRRPPGMARCMACGQDTPLASRADPCPDCGSHQLLVTEGDQLRLKTVELV